MALAPMMMKGAGCNERSEIRRSKPGDQGQGWRAIAELSPEQERLGQVGQGVYDVQTFSFDVENWLCKSICLKPRTSSRSW